MGIRQFLGLDNERGRHRSRLNLERLEQRVLLGGSWPIIERVSVADDGTGGQAASQEPSISADGRYVAFESDASNLVPGDTNGVSDIFVYDRAADTIERVSVAADDTVQLAVSDGSLGRLEAVGGNIDGIAVEVRGTSRWAGRIGVVRAAGAPLGIVNARICADGRIGSLVVGRAWQGAGAGWTGGDLYNTSIEAGALARVLVSGQTSGEAT